MDHLPPLYACTFCGDRVNPTAPGTWRQITGWVEQRTGGGAHSIAMPGAPLAYACAACMFDVKHGIDRHQERLF